MAEFAGYGFAKSHSTAYALITYQTAYLKANHPREYMAALLTIEAGNHDKLARYIAHARERGIDILAPDVNESERDFTVVREGIRFGFAGVKNVGEGAIEAILEARAGGPFAQPVRLRVAHRQPAREPARGREPGQVRRVRLAARRARARSGPSLDVALEARRRRAARPRDRPGEPVRRRRRRARPSPRWSPRRRGPTAQRLEHEKEVLGFYVTGHPLREHARPLARFTTLPARPGAGRARRRREVRVGGLLGGAARDAHEARAT